ncbi:unnamed protein product, partial [Boreogadus saida]
VPWPPRTAAELWRPAPHPGGSRRRAGADRPTDPRAGRGDAHDPASPTRGPCRS